MATGCYPGTFDPPTIAHVAIARAALEQCGLERLDFVISLDAINKPAPAHSRAERVRMLREATGDDPRFAVVVTKHRLLVDIAAGYDVLVLGADKWAEVVDSAYYGSPQARDEALRRLPPVACAPRAGFEPPPGAVVLRVEESLRNVSASAVRAGASAWRAVPDRRTRQSPE